MPDRHGPMRVVYQQRGGDEELPPTTWDTFENDTPEDVLDRITRGILQTDPQWLADALTPTEVTAVETAFGVTIGDSGGGGGDIERPADRFGIERFDGSADVTSDGITNLYYMIRVSDTDDDGDVTGFRLEATAADDTTDSFEYLPEGPDTGNSERSNFEAGLFVEQYVQGPITVTLSAADEDSAGTFVELATQTYPEEPVST